MTSPPTVSSASERARRLIAAPPVLCVGVAVPLLMRLPLPRLARVLEPRRRVAAAVDRDRVVGEVLSRVDGVLRRGRPLVREGCLTRGVTRYWFLRRAGVEVSLVFGTGRIEGAIEAHCWVTLDGAALREPDDSSFRALAVIRAPGVVEGIEECTHTN